MAATYDALGSVTGDDGVPDTPPAPAPKNQPNVAESKTNKSSNKETDTNTQPSGELSTTFNNADAAKFQAATEKNILHNYRSWTYNFALGAITPRGLIDQTRLAKDIKNFAVLNSAGKGTTGVGLSEGGLNEKSENYEYSKGLVDGFNKDSAGRFDMFIDNVQIDSILGHSQQGGTSIATNIGFEVYEPYSMNGFIDKPLL